MKEYRNAKTVLRISEFENQLSLNPTKLTPVAKRRDEDQIDNG